MAASSLHRYINVLGTAATLAYLAMSLLSYLQAPALWDPAYAPNATAFFNALYGTEQVDAIRALFGGPLAVVVTHWVPLIIASAAAVALLFLLSQAVYFAGGDDGEAGPQMVHCLCGRQQYRLSDFHPGFLAVDCMGRYGRVGHQSVL